MLENYPEILTIHDVCMILRIERRLVYRLINDGDLSARKVGSRYRIPKQALIEYINAA